MHTNQCRNTMNCCSSAFCPMKNCRYLWWKNKWRINIYSCKHNFYLTNLSQNICLSNLPFISFTNSGLFKYFLINGGGAKFWEVFMGIYRKIATWLKLKTTAKLSDPNEERRIKLPRHDKLLHVTRAPCIVYGHALALGRGKTSPLLLKLLSCRWG